MNQYQEINYTEHWWQSEGKQMAVNPVLQALALLAGLAMGGGGGLTGLEQTSPAVQSGHSICSPVGSLPQHC